MRTAGKRGKPRSWAECPCALAVVVLVASSAQAAEEANPTVRVRVYNYAELSQGVLVSAEKEASRIFRAAGVDTMWTLCPIAHIELQSVSVQSGQVQEAREQCAGEAKGAMVDLRILPRCTPVNRAFGDATFGFADGRSMATVLYGCVKDLTLRVDGDERAAPVILGAVIAHELGHSLLGTASHSPSGIMRADWDPVFLREARRGREIFSSQQSSLMRATLLRRQAEVTQP